MKNSPPLFNIQFLCILILFPFIHTSALEMDSHDSLNLTKIPRLKCPLYVMEYHVWYRSPFGNGPLPGYIHWGDTSHIDFALPQDQNLRDFGAVGYPFLGLYNSETPAVIRWQLRCAHQAGLDGLFVQLFPDRETGTYLGGSKIFGTMLKIAAEEHVMIAVHDEVMFRSKWKAQQPEVMAVRISDFIKRFGSDPAYLKIDGHPVYAFQYWTEFISPEKMASCLDQAEKLAGRPIHFFILGGAEPLYARKSSTSFVVTGNSMFIKKDRPASPPSTADWLRLSSQMLALPLLQMTYPTNKFGLWGYPGFDDAPQSQSLQNVSSKSFSRDEGEVLTETLAKYSRSHPDFIILSSWNDWLENTALEPGYRFDVKGQLAAPDPYRYLRILAKAKELTFFPPPLPPKEAVDPLRWQSLYGADATPPLLKSFGYDNERKEIDSVWNDSGNPVTRAVLALTGDAWADFLSTTNKNVQLKMEAERISPQIGFLLTPKAPLAFQVEGISQTEAFPQWYLALQFQDQSAGTIKIRYTADPPDLDYREFDGVSFPAAAVIRATGSGIIRSEISLLRAARSTTAQPLDVTISLENSENPDSGIYLRRVDVFHTLENSITGVCSETFPKTGENTHFLFRLEKKPQAVFLLGQDEKMNWSSPQFIFIH